jgi:hypothetical protein
MPNDGVAFHRETSCSFCGNDNVSVCEKNGKTICQECLYLAAQVVGTIPLGAIYCFGCKNYIKFDVKYRTSVVSFLFSGIDVQNRIIYTKERTIGDWSSALVPLGIVCACCSAKIPMWMAKHSTYLGSK